MNNLRDSDVVDEVIAAYLSCAGWLVVENHDPAEHSCGWEDTNQDPPCAGSPCEGWDYREGPWNHRAIEDAVEAWETFVDLCGEDDLLAYLRDHSTEDLGHDLYLSSHGHGAGFFDRGQQTYLKRLQDQARYVGEQTHYVTEDGFVDVY